MNNSDGRRLVVCRGCHILFQSIQMFTRCNNILDLVFTNECDIIHAYEIIESLTSRYDMVRIVLNFQTNRINNYIIIKSRSR